jgi:hypothetical protein
MTELEKLVQTWEKHKPTGTPHEHIWNGFIDDAKAAIEREKQALNIADAAGRSEQLVCDHPEDERTWMRSGKASYCNKCGELIIVSEREFAVNDYVWHNERLHKITKLRDNDEFWKGVEVQIFDIEARTTDDVSRNDLTHVR